MENNKPMTAEEKDLNYWRKNAEEDYIKVPISVLRYITELESAVQSAQQQPQGSELPSEVLIPLTDAVAFAQWRGSEHGLNTDSMTLVEEYNAFLQSQSKQKGETNE